MNSVIVAVFLAGLPAADNDARLSSSHDEMTEVTWYESSNAADLSAAMRAFALSDAKSYSWSSWREVFVSLTFGYSEREERIGPLVVQILYDGSDWVFADRVVVKADQGTPFTLLPTNSPEHEIAYKGVKEKLNLPLDKKETNNLCSPAVTKASSIKLRLAGGRPFDFVLPEVQRIGLANVCEAYMAVTRSENRNQKKSSKTKKGERPARGRSL